MRATLTQHLCSYIFVSFHEHSAAASKNCSQYPGHGLPFLPSVSLLISVLILAISVVRSCLSCILCTKPFQTNPAQKDLTS